MPQVHGDYLVLLTSNLGTSKTTTRPRNVSRPRNPIVIPAIKIHDAKFAKLESLLRLIQRQDIDREEFVQCPLKFELAVAPTMDSTRAAEVLVDVL